MKNKWRTQWNNKEEENRNDGRNAKRNGMMIRFLEASRSFEAWNSQWGSATGARGSGWMVAPNPSNFEPVRSFEAKKWAKKKAIWNMNFIENGSENVLTISAAEMWELFQ